MSDTQALAKPASEKQPPRALDMKFEFIVLPVANVERAKEFYSGLGWKLDMDFARSDNFRVVQFTPPGSGTSIMFGKGITSATPGTAQGLYLVVSDIEAVRADLLARGAAVGELFHDEGGVFHHANGEDRVIGPAPERRSYGTFSAFNDPDGNGWLIQEVTTRLPGHVTAPATTFNSASELAGALRRAQSAYAAQGRSSGTQGDDWPARYADYIVAEQGGKTFPV